MFRIILQAVLMLVFSYTAQVFMKKGAAFLSGLNWEKIVAHPSNTLALIIFNWQIMLGFALAGVGALIYLFVLSKNDFGVIFPILGALGFRVLPLVSWLILNEAVTPWSHYWNNYHCHRHVDCRARLKNLHTTTLKNIINFEGIQYEI